MFYLKPFQTISVTTTVSFFATFFFICIFSSNVFAQAYGWNQQRTLPESFRVDNNHDEIIAHLLDRYPNHYSVKFSLTKKSNITWWKGIKVFNEYGKEIYSAGMQDNDHGPKSSSLIHGADLGKKIRVEFWKAKAFGIHTHVGTKYYYVSEIMGKEVYFTWMND